MVQQLWIWPFSLKSIHFVVLMRIYVQIGARLNSLQGRGISSVAGHCLHDLGHWRVTPLQRDGDGAVSLGGPKKNNVFAEEVRVNTPNPAEWAAIYAKNMIGWSTCGREDQTRQVRHRPPSDIDQGLEHSSLMRESMKVPLHYIETCIYILCFAAFPPQPKNKATHHTVRFL